MGTSLQRCRVLLVDDHQDTRDLLVRLLSQSFNVSVAGCYDSALAQANENPPDVVVTDVGLPGRDGVALMRELHSRYGVSGIAVTGHAIDEVVFRAAGFVRWLRKPIRFEELLSAMNAACGATAK
jgi:DNA-binding response OmpR family regulator